MNIEEAFAYIELLEFRLIHALNPAPNHEFSSRTLTKFREVIKDNIYTDTCTIKRLLKDCWNNPDIY